MGTMKNGIEKAGRLRERERERGKAGSVVVVVVYVVAPSGLSNSLCWVAFVFSRQVGNKKCWFFLLGTGFRETVPDG